MSLRELIDVSNIPNIRVSGRGGKESVIGALLPGWNRVNNSLYDYEQPSAHGFVHIEVKKQTNLQWFDVGKYHSLNQTSRRIWMLFVVHKKGTITHLLVTSLGAFVDFMCSNASAQKDGWNAEVLEIAARFKRDYPRLQFKIPAKVLTLHKSYPGLFEVLFERC